jgi:hypothetical protein
MGSAIAGAAETPRRTTRRGRAGAGATGDRPAGRFRRKAALADHWPFIALLVAGATVRLLTFLAYRPALEYVQDSFSYLYDARHLVPNVIRPDGYSLWLRLLQTTGRFSVIPLSQHVMGLAVGMLLYALLRRLGLGRWLAALGAAPVLIDGYQIYIEQFVLAETLFELFVTGALVLVLWNRRLRASSALAAGALLALATVTRTVALGLLACTGVAILLLRVGWRPIAALVASSAVIIGGYAAWFHASTGHFGLEAYDGYFLAGTAQSFADCSRYAVPPDERMLCDPRAVGQRPGPDYYVHAEEAPLRRRDGVPGPTRNRMALAFGLRVIAHQPLDYARHILGNVAHYLSPGLHSGAKDNTVQSWQYLTTYHAEPWHPEYPPADPYNTNWTWPGPETRYQVVLGRWGFGLREQVATVNPPLSRHLRRYQELVSSSGGVLAVALLAGVVAGVGAVPPKLRHLRCAAWLMAAWGLLVLLMPSAIASFDYRYRLPALALLPPAGAAGVALARGRWSARRGTRAPAGGGRLAGDGSSWERVGIGGRDPIQADP